VTTKITFAVKFAKLGEHNLVGIFADDAQEPMLGTTISLACMAFANVVWGEASNHRFVDGSERETYESANLAQWIRSRDDRRIRVRRVEGVARSDEQTARCRRRNMSAEIGRIKGKSHPISVSVSNGGIELQMWEDARGMRQSRRLAHTV